ncbi:MAG: class I SAM-dependent methyltransferase [Candidatus Poribacteria bacterium]|nr:class I SAM-dependent methyltransferase [Candidatus Poribacteria bacterium]
MSDYDQFAAIYDLDMGHKTDDIPMVRRYAQMQGSPILELACGTGRILIPLAKQGFDVYGVDNSPAMLDVARQKVAKAEDSLRGKITLIDGDMQDAGSDPTSPLHSIKFNLVLIAFNSFLHLLTRQDQERTLRNIRNILSDNGLLLIDIFAPHHHVLAQADDTQIYQHIRYDEARGKTYVRSDRVRRNLAQQTQEVEFIYDELQADGDIKRTIRTVHTRYVFRYEMELLLELTGYEVVDLFGGYDGERYDYHSGIMVFVARKSDCLPRNRLYL